MTEQETRPELPRRLLHPTDIVWIGALLVICGLALLLIYRPWTNQAEVTAQISSQGVVVREIDLSAAEDTTFVLAENPKVSFQIENHAIRFVNTDCPDHLCENVGYLSQPNHVAICLPNQVSLQILSDQAEIDAIVD